jgi:hypothetical protein
LCVVTTREAVQDLEGFAGSVLRLGTDAEGDDGEGGETGGQGGEGGEGEGEGGKRASTTRACGCGRQIRVSAAEYTRGYIMCGLCGKPFLTPGETDEPADRVVWLARATAVRAA